MLSFILSAVLLAPPPYPAPPPLKGCTCTDCKCATPKAPAPPAVKESLTTPTGKQSLQVAYPPNVIRVVQDGKVIYENPSAIAAPNSSTISNSPLSGQKCRMVNGKKVCTP